MSSGPFSHILPHMLSLGKTCKLGVNSPTHSELGSKHPSPPYPHPLTHPSHTS